MELYVELSRDEIEGSIPYSMLCMTRFGSVWNTMRRKRRWSQEFSEKERRSAEEIFRKAHNFTVRSGVPDARTLVQAGRVLRLTLKGGLEYVLCA